MNTQLELERDSEPLLFVDQLVWKEPEIGDIGRRVNDIAKQRRELRRRHIQLIDQRKQAWEQSVLQEQLSPFAQGLLARSELLGSRQVALETRLDVPLNRRMLTEQLEKALARADAHIEDISCAYDQSGRATVENSSDEFITAIHCFSRLINSLHGDAEMGTLKDVHDWFQERQQLAAEDAVTMRTMESSVLGDDEDAMAAKESVSVFVDTFSHGRTQLLTLYKQLLAGIERLVANDGADPDADEPPAKVEDAASTVAIGSLMQHVDIQSSMNVLRTQLLMKKHQFMDMKAAMERDVIKLQSDLKREQTMRRKITDKIQAQVLTLQQKNDSNEKTIQHLTSVKIDAEKQASALKFTVQTLQTEKTEWKRERRKLQTRLRALEQEQRVVSDMVVQLGKSSTGSTTGGSWTDAVKDTLEHLHRIEQQKIDIERDHDYLLQRMSELTNRENGLQRQIAELRSANARWQEQVTALSLQVRVSGAAPVTVQANPAASHLYDVLPRKRLQLDWDSDDPLAFQHTLLHADVSTQTAPLSTTEEGTVVSSTLDLVVSPPPVVQTVLQRIPPAPQPIVSATETSDRSSEKHALPSIMQLNAKARVPVVISRNVPTREIDAAPYADDHWWAHGALETAKADMTPVRHPPVHNPTPMEVREQQSLQKLQHTEHEIVHEFIQPLHSAALHHHDEVTESKHDLPMSPEPQSTGLTPRRLSASRLTAHSPIQHPPVSLPGTTAIQHQQTVSAMLPPSVLQRAEFSGADIKHHAQRPSAVSPDDSRFVFPDRLVLNDATGLKPLPRRPKAGRRAVAEATPREDRDVVTGPSAVDSVVRQTPVITASAHAAVLSRTTDTGDRVAVMNVLSPSTSPPPKPSPRPRKPHKSSTTVVTSAAVTARAAAVAGLLRNGQPHDHVAALRSAATQSKARAPRAPAQLSDAPLHQAAPVTWNAVEKPLPTTQELMQRARETRVPDVRVPVKTPELSLIEVTFATGDATVRPVAVRKTENALIAPPATPCTFGDLLPVATVLAAPLTASVVMASNTVISTVAHEEHGISKPLAHSTSVKFMTGSDVIALPQQPLHRIASVPQAQTSNPTQQQQAIVSSTLPPDVLAAPAPAPSPLSPDTLRPTDTVLGVTAEELLYDPQHVAELPHKKLSGTKLRAYPRRPRRERDEIAEDLLSVSALSPHIH
eukprot:TRINITY_DN6647_c0_g2_i1.p1 TRINITY_DN6647_c0_g2~~TRINITY_DN6647_c0_g2_i1.p1  ORF type:complete len:1178 (-),score=283.70 TRINITY_DN6647_c0_g2_i1:139-3672(-)